MDRKEFEETVIEALDELPDFFKKKIENLSVVVEDEPTPEQLDQVHVSGRDVLLGLYQGIPLAERTHFYGSVMPDKITIFKKSIERVYRTRDEVKKAVIHTVQHELAHHFGITDEELKKWGKY
ncbi:MAG: metallopeptidase family protein [Armatimonadota bacterium]